jgi:hypothetical protein
VFKFALEAHVKSISRRRVLAVAVAAAMVPTGTWAQDASLGTPTPGMNPNALSYRTAEYANRANNVINAEAAYARGWTGRGSTVLIMDTGINASHPDLAGKIKYSRDFTGTGLKDNVGHGTHLAGVVAAARNGSGTHGVAFDANLAVAKIANSSTLIWRNANGAMAWASQYQDVTVANLSANVNYHASYQAASRQVAPGLWINTHAAHGGANYYNLERPESLIIPKNMALTVSAGNQTTPYVQNPATFAVATDSAGNLVHGGRMLVVGMWNSGRSVIEGATAGHMCKDYRNSTCFDRYRISDFYILAPGAGVISTSNTGTGTRNMGGTSQSAAVAAGALAVINQMWPYMTPENQVQVLLRTANKNLPNYRTETHGQGLLDLDRATQPIGAVGLTKTGRTGQALPITPIVMTGSTSAVAGRLSSVTVVDELQRDFTANLSGAVGQRSLMGDPMALQHQPGQSWSAKLVGVHAYQLAGYSVGGQGTNSTMSLDSRMLGSTGPGRHQITFTQAAYNPFIQYSGAWGTISSSSTIEYDYTYRDRSGLWLQTGAASTTTTATPGLIERVNAIQTVHAVAGYSHGGMNIYAGIQPWIVAGSLQMRLPGAVDEQGTMSYESSRINLAGQRPMAYAGTNYTQNLDRSTRMILGLAGNQAGDYRAAVNLVKQWQ